MLHHGFLLPSKSSLTHLTEPETTQKKSSIPALNILSSSSSSSSPCLQVASPAGAVGGGDHVVELRAQADAASATPTLELAFINQRTSNARLGVNQLSVDEAAVDEAAL